jgi:hypothetical protein
MLFDEDFYEDSEGYLSSYKAPVFTKLFKFTEIRDVFDFFSFCGKYKSYAIYNNMLVKLQKRSVLYYDSEVSWERKHKRTLREDSKPILVISPNGPISVVYDFFDTKGTEDFASFHEANYGKYYNKCTEKYSKIDEGISEMCKTINFNVKKYDLDIIDIQNNEEYLVKAVRSICKLFLGHYGAFEREIKLTNFSLRKLSISPNISEKSLQNLEVDILHFIFCSRYNIKYNENYLLTQLYNNNQIDKINIDFLIKTASVLIKIFNKFNVEKKDDFRNHMDEIFPEKS